MVYGHNPLRRVSFVGRGGASNDEAVERQSNTFWRDTRRKQQPAITEVEAASKGRQGADFENGIGGDETPNSGWPEATGPSNWVDHPITRALDGLYQNGAVPDPVRVIADSVDRGPHDTDAAQRTFPVVEAVVSVDARRFMELGPYAQFW